jgi:hypothetical protein
MKKYTTTKQLITSELQKLTDLGDVNKVLRIAAFESLDMVAARIQQEGKDSSGEVMQTSSPKKFGAYSESWGKNRAKRGRQTTRIDFTDTGDLFEAWRVFPLSRKSIGVGFFGDEVQKARWLTEMFGNVFELTRQQRKEILELIIFEVNNIMNK